MQILLVILLTANLVALGWMAWRQARMRSFLVRLEHSAQELAPLHAELNDDLQRQLRRGADTVISVEILNPLEVASRASWFAGQFGSVAPRLIRREVYRQAREIMERQLREKGIEPRVQLHGGA